MDSHQHDLLAVIDKGRVSPFPFASLTGRVKRCAEVLSRKSGRDADAYVQRTFETLTKKLLAAGLSETELNEQFDQFVTAVNNEMNRRRVFNLAETEPDAS